MDSLRIWAQSLLLYSWFVVSTLLAWTLFLLVTPYVLLTDPVHRRLLNRITAAWGYQFATLMPFWRCRWEGREHARGGPYMIVANHQSFADIPVVFGLGHPFKIVSKRAIFQAPILGWAMRINDYIEVIRGDAASVAQMMAHCERHLRDGNSILMFAEGTRSRDGRLQPFKHGAFTLAHATGVPVLPVVLDHTHEVLPKDGWLFQARWGLEVPVRVLPPLDPAEYDGPDALSAATRRAMARALAELREVPVEEVLTHVAPKVRDRRPTSPLASLTS